MYPQASGTDVSVIDLTLATPVVITTFNGGNNPLAVAITPHGTLAYITDSTIGTPAVRVFSVPSNTLVATISTGFVAGAGLRGVAITPNGEFAYVTDFINGVVYQIPITGPDANTIIDTIPVGSRSTIYSNYR